jgi:hypothetical protein
MEPEIEESWRLIKASYPGAVVFHQVEDVFFVRGQDADILRRAFGLRCGDSWVGFDHDLATTYMRELAGRGHSVVRVSNGSVVPVQPRRDRRAELQRQRARSKFIALDPCLLFDRGPLERLRVQNAELYLRFQALLRNGRGSLLKDEGELYVFPVHDWYEIDRELSTMSLSRAMLLAKAALITNQNVPCRLVRPKPWRDRAEARRNGRTLGPITTQIGQLPLFDSD